MSDVRRFMKCPGLRHPEAIEIDAPDGLAESQHPIEEMQRKSQDLSCVGVGAMMRVVKQRTKSELRLVRKDCPGYIGIRPLVNDDDIGIAQLLF